MRFQTINPATEEVLAAYETMSKDEVFQILGKVNKAYASWRWLPLEQRAYYFRTLAVTLRRNKERWGKLASLEMGKPITAAIAEIEKCALTAEVYADNAKLWLQEETVQADGKEHKVIYQSLGVILAVMPWNFPFWQAFRFAIPTLLAGNVAILKHSNQVPACALAIEQAFIESGFPENVFRTVIADHDTIKDLVASDVIQGVSLTGSTEAGKRIAELAGKNLKKVVLELGGSDPFIVLEDADLDFVAKHAVTARFANCGQSCIAAKRFIVVKDVAETFAKKFAEATKNLVVGDPLNPKTTMGPLVNTKARQEIEEQVNDAVAKGAILLAGGKKREGKGAFYLPTVLTNANKTMKVVSEEVFGPVAPVIVVKDEAEAITVANNSEFGLGGSVWTKNIERGKRVAEKIESGAVFVNMFTKSDPRMPFGGIKKSGIGRELSKYGLHEFVNIKAMNVYEHSA